MLYEVIAAVWIGAIVGAILKLASPHPRLGSWLIAALVGGVGGMCGLFVARMLGVSRELPTRTYAVAAVVAAIAVLIYAMISRVVVGRLNRARGRRSRPTIAF